MKDNERKTVRTHWELKSPMCPESVEEAEASENAPYP